MTKAIILSGFGFNGEREAKFAFELAGAQADIIHLNDLIIGEKKLTDYEIMYMGSGFSYADNTGSGNAYANKIRNNLWDQLMGFLEEEKLVLGICNGFQVLSNLGILPGFVVPERKVALRRNRSNTHEDVWVDLKVGNNSPWLKGIDHMHVPVGHGEGNFYCDSETLTKLKNENMIAVRYTKNGSAANGEYPYNPNGALEDIAGITDKSGRIIGMMPHPDRALLFTNMDYWPKKKEELKRAGKGIPKYGEGLQLFRNGVEYFKR